MWRNMILTQGLDEALESQDKGPHYGLDVKRHDARSISAPELLLDNKNGTLSQECVALCTDKVIWAYDLVRAGLEVATPRGANKHKILRGTGIFDDAIVPDMQISVGQYLAFLDNIRSQTKGHDISFLIGSTLAHSLIQKGLGYPLWSQTQPDVPQCLVSVFRFLFYGNETKWRVFPLVFFREFNVNNKCVFIAEVNVDSAKLAQFVLEIGLCALVTLLKHIMGKRVPLRYTFRVVRPRHIADFETHLGLHSAFQAPLNSVSVDSNFSSFEPVTSDAGSFIRSDDMPVTASAMLLPDIVRHQLFHCQNAALSVIAQRCNMSVATLKRKLKEYGASYRALHEEVQYHQAIVLLSLAKVSNEKAAKAMHISDLPNFRRVVKRLTGKTPSELRGI